MKDIDANPQNSDSQEGNSDKDWDQFRKVPVGIFHSIPYIFSPKTRFALDPHKKYRVEDLSLYAARCELLYQYVRILRHAINQTSIFILLMLHTTPPKPLYSIISISGPVQSGDYIGYVLWYLFLLSAFVLSCFVIFFLFLILYLIARKKKQWEKLKPEIKSQLTLNPGDYMRSLPNAWIYLILILFYFWGAQFLFHVTFNFGDETRALNGLEFVYFFLMTFTTVGFGDITPSNNTGYVFTIFIHLLTLYSVIFLFHKVAQGPRKQVIDTHLNELKKQHKNRLELINNYIFHILEKDPNDKLICPVPHKRKPGGAKGCPVCFGTHFVTASTVLPYSTWPPSDFMSIIITTTGVTKEKLVAIFSSTNSNQD